MKNSFVMVLLLSLIAMNGDVIAEDSEAIVWQLGHADCSGSEFTPQYRAWEYGNAPAIRTSPSMNHDTHTFHYDIQDNKVINDPQVVSSLYTEAERFSMNADEIVTGLSLSWNEEAAGNRKLELVFSEWRNMIKGRSGNGDLNQDAGFEVLLPDGSKRQFFLPAGKSNKDEPLSVSMVFAAQQGTNRLTIRIKSMIKHYHFNFDYLALYKSNAPVDATPLLESSFDEKNGVYEKGQPATLQLNAFNLTEDRDGVQYSVINAFEKIVSEGTVFLKNAHVEIPCPTQTNGWYQVTAKLGDAVTTSSYAVLEPVKTENIPDSRFGCHALCTDSYRIRNWPQKQEEQMKYAFMAGARWVRYHSMHWFLREPEKGKYDWTFFDERLALAEKYKMNVMLTLGGTPLWASTSDDKKLTICGSHRYEFYPPADWKNWEDFVQTVVGRYKDRIKWYEMWNEPGYSSAFWSNGSASDFSMLLKTGYLAAKSAAPECVVVSGAPLTKDFMGDVIKHNNDKLFFDVMSVHYMQNSKSGGDKYTQWKSTLEQKGGKDTPFINSEEMHWTSDGGRLDIACKLIKVYTREAALGIQKTFAFDFFRRGSWFNVSAFDYCGRPQPQYAAYRTMTHRLEHATYIANLSTKETEAYLFDRSGISVLVFWSDKDGKMEIPHGKKTAEVINIMDEGKIIQTDAGILRIKALRIPQFIEGGDFSLLKSYAGIIRRLPSEIVLAPGESVTRQLPDIGDIESVSLQVPDAITGAIQMGKLNITAPETISSGMYDASVSFILNGYFCTVPVIIDVNRGIIGENLIRNGDFSKGNVFFFFPKDENEFDVVAGVGIDGTNAAMTRGAVMFGCAGGIKVRKGEKYALIVEAKGEGHLGGIISIRNKNGQKIYPNRQGINCLDSKVEPQWKTYVDEFTIAQEDADILKFALLANYGDKDNREILFNKIAIIRLTEGCTINKILWHGECGRIDSIPVQWNEIPAMTAEKRDQVIDSKSAKWHGIADLSASCKLAMDDDFLHLRFCVRDDIHNVIDEKSEEAWEFDSVQFSIDPTAEGKDKTEITVFQNSSGVSSAYKNSNFWTPELPAGITSRGIIPDADISVNRTTDETVYSISIPLTQLYPLSANCREFGFSWLVNDNDGSGRKYIQWSSGIGVSKNAALFGIAKCFNQGN